MDDIMSSMDVSRPYKAVCPSLDGDVLQTLAGTKTALTGRQVAQLTGKRSHSGVLNVLNRLAEHGLVDRVELNRASLFSLNRDHLAYPAVVALSEMRAALLGHLRRQLREWETAPAHASLFGSTARGDGDTQSDIDVFVVRPTGISEENRQWRKQVDELEDSTGRLTGNRVAVLEASEAELARLRDEEPPIVVALRADAIVLSGPTFSVLLGGE
jgi:predicted nucleotidyltransferase